MRMLGECFFAVWQWVAVRLMAAGVMISFAGWMLMLSTCVCLMAVQSVHSTIRGRRLRCLAADA